MLSIATSCGLATSCGSRTTDLQPSAPASQPSRSTPSDPAPNEQARARLGSLGDETLRLAFRLQRKGTPDQRARWQEQLSAINHDRQVLAAAWLDAERLPRRDRLAAHTRLAKLIDVLYTVNARTAVEIDLAPAVAAAAPGAQLSE